MPNTMNTFREGLADLAAVEAQEETEPDKPA